MENHNVFAGAYVDRISERRKDPDWLANSLLSDESRFVPVWGDQCMVGGDPLQAVMLKRDQIRNFFDDEEAIFLGLFRDRPTFALAIDVDVDVDQPCSEFGEFHDLRFLGTVLSLDEANLVAQARAMVLWHASQPFCGTCGSLTRSDSGGNSRVCVSDDCRREFFPQVDPAVIVLVSMGDRCLLGRQPSWPDGRYSTIAGFIEAGECLEDAVRREVYEETNIQIADIRYHSSQPWPFPSSLMLGFLAEATSSEVVLNDGELEDAQWFTRKDLRSGFPKLPFRISIARRLVDYWIDLGSGN